MSIQGTRTNIKHRRNRRMMILFGSLFILLMVSALLSTLYSLQPNSYELTQTQDFEVYKLTQTQAIKMTQDFQALQQTQSAQGIETATPDVDDFAKTATALIGQLTEDANFVRMTQEGEGFETNTPSPPDDFAYTATTLIGQLTEDANFVRMTQEAETVEAEIPTQTPTDVWR